MREKHKEILAFETHLGAELHRRSADLTRAWLDRLIERQRAAPRPGAQGEADDDAGDRETAGAAAKCLEHFVKPS